MKIIDILERELGSKTDAKTQKIRCSEDYLKRLPSDGDVHQQIVTELSQLNTDEIARFDSWTTKGSSMLGASGLLLALTPLGLSITNPRVSPESWPHLWWWSVMAALFLMSAALFFLATWDALVSLRARPLCRLDEDGWLSGEEKTSAEVRRSLAADKLVTYKNNMDIVDLKGTKVNQAWRHFFLGCLAHAVFMALALAMQTYWPA